MIDRGAAVKITSIPAPATTWRSPLAAVKAGLEAEEFNTVRLNKLMDLAITEKDHATKGLMQWFVDEQVEEEANFSELIDQLTLAEKAPGAMFMLDKDLGQRTLPPIAGA